MNGLKDSIFLIANRPKSPKAAKERLFERLLREECRRGRDKEIHVTQKTQISHESSVCSVSSVCQSSSKSLPPVLKTLVQKIIAETIPKEPGRRHRAIFEFARHMKSVSRLAEVPVDQLRECVEWWHEARFPR